MRTIGDAIREEHPHLLVPRGMCQYCGIRTAKVGSLCCACDDDADAPERRGEHEMNKVTALEVVEMSTGKVVETVKLQPHNNPDKVTAGMLRNMDTERYFVREVKKSGARQ